MVTSSQIPLIVVGCFHQAQILVVALSTKQPQRHFAELIESLVDIASVSSGSGIPFVRNCLGTVAIVPRAISPCCWTPARRTDPWDCGRLGLTGSKCFSRTRSVPDERTEGECCILCSECLRSARAYRSNQYEITRSAVVSDERVLGMRQRVC